MSREISKDSGAYRAITAVLVGDIVGKTSLCRRLQHGRWSYHLQATIGVEFSTKTFYILGKKVKVHLCDLTSCDLFHFTSGFARVADLIFLCSSITCRHSFLHLPDWFDVITKYVSPSTTPIVLLLTKVDLEDCRVVTLEEAEKFARERNLLGPFETSAKTGEGVTEAFTTALEHTVKLLGSKLLKRAYDNVWSSFNACYVWPDFSSPPQPIPHPDPLSAAAITGDLAKAGTLAISSRVNREDKEGLTALEHAAKTGQSMVAKLLLEKGAKVREERHPAAGQSTLSLALSEGALSTSQLLLACGTNVFQHDTRGKMSLYNQLKKHRLAPYFWPFIYVNLLLELTKGGVNTANPATFDIFRTLKFHTQKAFQFQDLNPDDALGVAAHALRTLFASSADSPLLISPLPQYNLMTLNLSGIPLDHELSELTRAFIYRNIMLRVLDLSGTGLNNSNLTLIVKGKRQQTELNLATATQLSELRFKDNAFQDGRASIIAEYLTQATEQLKRLDLHSNHIRHWGAFLLIAAIIANRGLQNLQLNLTCNQIGKLESWAFYNWRRLPNLIYCIREFNHNLSSDDKMELSDPDRAITIYLEGNPLVVDIDAIETPSEEVTTFREEPFFNPSFGFNLI